MSFITKRERVFNEYDLFDLPPRNEGKLKAYASCTDARAWSHFCSDKAEHLVEIIKRNNETVRPKYIPTKVIVETLMVAKNAEISRLKQKIEEFEQLLAAYDQLDLTCDQKCEIANAHAAIRAANKELDEMCLELDLSGYTEALDSEAFETGKSRGDGDEEQEAIRINATTETKSVQMGTSCTCDVGTLIKDKRIDEMEDIIINKDAKLNAIKNTIAVYENDLCEPYCIYANIYTALEKIFAALSQNDKYRQYLKLLIAGKDTCRLDTKGKILFKLKVLEIFSGALIAPCNREFPTPNPKYDSVCFRNEVKETNFAMNTSIERTKYNFDSKRAHLVADIIQNEDMKEILSKESYSDKSDTDVCEDECVIYDYNIETENLERLKKLQENYEDLITLYESLKHENEYLEIRCQKYEELEKEFENMKLQIQEYNSLWNEKEHYRKRSVDLDTLKEQYLILTDETVNLETRLKAETEINHIKCKTIEELRNENVIIEKKLNQAIFDFEKEKNNLLCKLREADCRIMCQDQQIKSLSLQIDRLLEQDQEAMNSREVQETSIALIDEVESHKDEIKNLKDALLCNEEEKQNLQQQYQNQLKLINELKIEVEDWKSVYEKTLQRNDYLEKYTESLVEETKALSQDVEEKSQAVENLMDVINSKSKQINELISEVENRKKENRELLQQIDELRYNFDNRISNSENEKMQALLTLKVARQESEELIKNVNDYNELLQKENDMSISFEIRNELQTQLMNATNENKSLVLDLAIRESKNSILLEEIQQLHQVNKFASDHIHSLQDENKDYRRYLEIKQKESDELKTKLVHFDNLGQQLQNLQDSNKNLLEEKKRLQDELLQKNNELENMMCSMHLNKCKSDELINRLQESESAKNELCKLSEAYQKLAEEKHTLQKYLLEKHNEITEQCKQIDILEKELKKLKKIYNELLSEKETLQYDFNNKKGELNNLYDILEKKIEDNQSLNEIIKSLEVNQIEAEKNIKILQDDNIATQAKLNVIKKESAELIDKIKYYETLESDFNELKKSHDLMKIEKQKLQNELVTQLADLKRIEKENLELHGHSQTIMSLNEDLEKALISSRTELIKNTTVPQKSYKDILHEIEEMRQEKLKNQKTIRDLRDKLEESENVISNLTEDIVARDDRIAILQNHINNLQKEVRELHNNLNTMVDTGEQMKDFSFQNLKNLEAHHSKATHNMKMELVQLQQQNAILEEQLSDTILKSDESSQNNRSLINKTEHLKNELDIIVTDIKQLEMETVGDSSLSVTSCDIQDILLSLDRIRDSFDARNSKSISLEQTISKVKTSSQLLLSKAEEAKILVEKEKQKIINEKEEAIKDRIEMEKQLLYLKTKLEKQITDDKVIIMDLEATISNQKLLFNKINKSAEEYTSKLKDELQTLKNLYHNSMEKIGELQTKVQNLSDDKISQMQLLEKIRVDFDVKSKEVCELQKELEEIKNKPFSDMDTQTKVDYNCRDVETQIETELSHINNLQIYFDKKGVLYSDKTIKTTADINNKLDTKSNFKQNQSQIEENQPPLNKVQILTASIEPTYDYDRRDNLSYDLQHSSIDKLQNNSISDTSANKRIVQQSSEEYHMEVKSDNLIDIYNRPSIHTDSSRANYYKEHLAGDIDTQDTNTLFEIATTDTNAMEKGGDNNNKSGPNINEFSEIDIFIIYKDSKSSLNNKTQSKNIMTEVAPKDVTVYTQESVNNNDKIQTKRGEFIYSKEGDENIRENNNVRHTLNIKIPRVENEAKTLLILSDSGKKSLDSCGLGRYSTSSKPIFSSDTKLIDNNNSRKNISPSLTTISFESPFYHDDLEKQVVHNNIKTRYVIDTDSGTSKQLQNISKKATKTPSVSKTMSYHKLSRVEANVLLVKNDKNIKSYNKSIKQKTRDFGLEYILDSVQAEINLNESENISQEIRGVKSDEIFNVIKLDTVDFSVSKSNHNNVNPHKHRVISSGTINVKSLKTFTERGIEAKLDINADYESTINSLTKALENIEKDYKKKIEAIKIQYDNNIKSIINEHNQGVKSIQNLHEDTLHDIIQTHENEVENLRSMSIEAMRKVEILEKENRALKIKVQERGTMCLEEESSKIPTHEIRKRRKSHEEGKLLTKTTIEAFNVKPKLRAHGPCTCSLDVNISDTIRNIFEQVDVEQRKMAEHTYIKYVANKILSGNIENLDAQELSFLHLKICRMWKNKLYKEEALQKRIDSLETELMNKQRNTQQHIAELDRQVAEERRRLQEVREAVCRNSTQCTRDCSPDSETIFCRQLIDEAKDKDCTIAYNCNTGRDLGLRDRGSAGDLAHVNGIRPRHTIRKETKMTTARLEVEERREKRLYNDEPPTRLRRSHDRQTRSKK